MIKVIYRDEDGLDSCLFNTRDEVDEFIKYNENRVKQYRDEKFEVISVTNE